MNSDDSNGNNSHDGDSTNDDSDGDDCNDADGDAASSDSGDGREFAGSLAHCPKDGDSDE
jgi:hypothetical protein